MNMTRGLINKNQNHFKRFSQVIGFEELWYGFDPYNHNVFCVDKSTGEKTFLESQLEYPTSIANSPNLIGVGSDWWGSMEFFLPTETSPVYCWSLNDLKGIRPRHLIAQDGHWFLLDPDQQRIFKAKQAKDPSLKEFLKLPGIYPHDFYFCGRGVWFLDKQAVHLLENGKIVFKHYISTPQFCNILKANHQCVYLLNAFENVIIRVEIGKEPEVSEISNKVWGFEIGGGLIEGLDTCTNCDQQEFPLPWNKQFHLETELNHGINEKHVLPFRNPSFGVPLTQKGKIQFQYKCQFKNDSFDRESTKAILMDLVDSYVTEPLNAMEITRLGQEFQFRISKDPNFCLREEELGTTRENCQMVLPIWAYICKETHIQSPQPYERDMEHKIRVFLGNLLLKFIAKAQTRHLLRIGKKEDFAGIRLANLTGQPELIHPLIEAMKKPKTVLELELIGLEYVLRGKYKRASNIYSASEYPVFEAKHHICQWLSGFRENKTLFSGLRGRQDKNYQLALTSFQKGNYGHALTHFESMRGDSDYAEVSALFEFFCLAFKGSFQKLKDLPKHIPRDQRTHLLISASIHLLNVGPEKAQWEFEKLRGQDHGSLMSGICARLLGQSELASKRFEEEDQKWPKWQNSIQLALLKIQQGSSPSQLINELPPYAWVQNKGEKIYAKDPNFLNGLKFLVEEEQKFPGEIHKDVLALWFNWHLIDPIPFHVFW